MSISTGMNYTERYKVEKTNKLDMCISSWTDLRNVMLK